MNYLGGSVTSETVKWIPSSNVLIIDEREIQIAYQLNTRMFNITGETFEPVKKYAESGLH